MQRQSKPPHLPLDEFWRLLAYDCASGRITWRVDRCHSRGAVAGAEAGCVRPNGYRYIMISGRQYLGHRVAWLLHHGVWPANLDHANGDRADNRIANLREANQSQNLCNRGRLPRNTSGFKGVSFEARKNRWRAAICIDGRTTVLGAGFRTAAEAHEAYKRAAPKIHGEFARTE